MENHRSFGVSDFRKTRSWGARDVFELRWYGRPHARLFHLQLLGPLSLGKILWVKGRSVKRVQPRMAKLLAFLFQVRMSCNLRFGVSMLVPLQGAPVGCFRVLLLEWCVHWPFRMVSALWRWLAGVAAGCCFRVLLLDWCVRVCFGAGVLVPLQGATSVVRMLCPLWSWRVSCRVACGCCRSQWCVRFGAGLLVCRVPLQGAASGCCQSDVCALELACWCSQSNVCVLELALLQDAASRCCC